MIAAYMFDLDLVRPSSHAHDAVARDGRRVEIKLTQGSSVAIRHEPDHLIVLCRPKGGPTRVIFNGPGAAAWAASGRIQTNGQRPISLTKLVALDRMLEAAVRLPILRAAPV